MREPVTVPDSIPELMAGHNDPDHDPAADQERTGPYQRDDPDDPERGHGH